MSDIARQWRPVYLEKTEYNRDRWMISYADVVTILLVLFIEIAAQSMARRPAAPHPVTPAVSRRLESAPAVSRVQTELQKRGIEFKMEPGGLVITLPQAVLFSSGDDAIRAEAIPTIKDIADVLQDVSNKVLLVGNADATPIHNQHFRNNWELSAARSIQLLAVLTVRFGLSEDRFIVASDGSHSPKVSNDNEEGRARNRRVEIVILDQNTAGASSEVLRPSGERSRCCGSGGIGESVLPFR